MSVVAPSPASALGNEEFVPASALAVRRGSTMAIRCGYTVTEGCDALRALRLCESYGTKNDCDCEAARSAAESGVRTQWAKVEADDKKFWVCCYCGRTPQRAIKVNAELSKMTPFMAPAP